MVCHNVYLSLLFTPALICVARPMIFSPTPPPSLPTILCFYYQVLINQTRSCRNSTAVEGKGGRNTRRWVWGRGNRRVVRVGTGLRTRSTRRGTPPRTGTSTHIWVQLHRDARPTTSKVPGILYLYCCSWGRRRLQCSIAMVAQRLLLECTSILW